MAPLLWKAGLETGHALSGMRAVGWQTALHSYAWSPPTDLYEIEAAYVVRMEVAGMRQADFSINIQDNFLLVSGVRQEEPERRAYHQMEIRFGEFSSAIELPGGVDVARAEAEYEDGFLIVLLPKLTPTGVQIKG